MILELRYAAVGFKRIDIAIRNDNIISLDIVAALYGPYLYADYCRMDAELQKNEKKNSTQSLT